MAQAAAHLIGQHDFTSFRSAECQAATPVRQIERLQVERRGPLVRISVTANAFLHHMVRNIVGALSTSALAGGRTRGSRTCCRHAIGRQVRPRFRRPACIWRGSSTILRLACRLPVQSRSGLMRTRIKICGLTREADVAAAVAAGADAIGFVCYPKSPRYVAPIRLRALGRELGVFAAPVLLFVNAASDLVEGALEMMPNALLQFHGDEHEPACQPVQAPVHPVGADDR